MLTSGRPYFIHRPGISNQTPSCTTAFHDHDRADYKYYSTDYVDDTILFSHRAEYIDEVVTQLPRTEELELEEEGDIGGFLGVGVQRDTKSGEIHVTKTLSIALSMRWVAMGCQEIKLQPNTELLR